MLSGSVSLFLNLPNCSAKSKTAPSSLAVILLPFCVLPPSIVVRLLKRSPIDSRSWCLGSRSIDREPDFDPLILNIEWALLARS